MKGAKINCLLAGVLLILSIFSFGGVTLNIGWAADQTSQIADNMVPFGNYVAVSFKNQNGLYLYNGTSWSKLTEWNPEDMLVRGSSLVVDFGEKGLYQYDGYSLTGLTGWSPSAMVTWGNNLAADFDSIGLYKYDGASWIGLAGWNPEDMVAWGSKLIVDFGANGLWQYNGSSWSGLAGWNPEDMVSWESKLILDFGTSGIWQYDGSSWKGLAGWNPENIAAFGSKLAADFGANGIWQYDGSSWRGLVAWNPENIMAFGNKLVGDFGANGLWQYDGSSWSRLSDWNAAKTVVWGDKLVADFGDKGIYYYKSNGFQKFDYSTLAGTPGGSNRKPVAYPLSLTADPAIPYLEKQLIATDADGDRLNYELTAPTRGSGYSEAFISPSSGMLYVTLSGDGTRSIRLPYHVSDGKIFSDSVNISIEVAASSDERLFGREEVDARTYAGFGVANFRSDLLGAAGEDPTVPASVDLSGNFPVPGSQGGQQSCVGWATAYALKTYQEKVEMGWSLNTAGHLFSPAFVYNQINGGQNIPTYIWRGLDIIKNKGCATFATIPYDQTDYRTQPRAEAFQEALNFKAKEWKRLNSTPSEIIAALVNRNPVVVGIDVYESLRRLSGSDSVYNTISGGLLGGHAVTIVGYDNNKYGGAFKVINSWGAAWGANGYFWIPYNSTYQIGMSEAYILEDAENTIADPSDDPVRPESTVELPNLEVESWSANYDPKPRGKGTWQWKVLNTGKGVAPAGADVNFMLSKNRTLTSSDVYVIYEEIPFDMVSGQDAYRNENNSISFEFPDTLEDGTYYMAVWVDDLDEIEESDEDDNVSWGSNQVTIENRLPDLEVETWYAEWDDYGYGSLTYEVANNGKTATSNTEWDINLVLSPDETIGNSNEIFLFYEDGNYLLEPGHKVYRDENNPASFYLYKDKLFGRPVPDGIYYMALWVDDLNEVEESNELNNSSIGWNVIEIGGYFRSEKKAAGKAYNGRKLPPADVVARKVQVRSTPGGGRSLEFLDEEAAEPKTGESTPMLPKTVSSKNHVIFPVIKEIPMPEPVVNETKRGLDVPDSEAQQDTAGVPNPAATACKEKGYLLEPILKNGVPIDYFCINPETGKKCGVWEYFREECNIE